MKKLMLFVVLVGLIPSVDGMSNAVVDPSFARKFAQLPKPNPLYYSQIKPKMDEINKEFQQSVIEMQKTDNYWTMLQAYNNKMNALIAEKNKKIQKMLGKY